MFAGNPTEINLTFETLFEILRIEKSKGDLQELPLNFIDDLRMYLTEKLSIATSEQLNPSEKQLAERQFKQALRIVEELLVVRQRKLLELARIKALSAIPELTMPYLLEGEQELLKSVVEQLRASKKKLYAKIFPDLEKAPSVKTAKQVKKRQQTGGLKRIIFLTAVPRFVGTELETYGPFFKGQQAELPEKIAEVLIRRGRARPA